MMLSEFIFLLLFIMACLIFAYILGRSPVRHTVETKITGKRVRYQESITASGNAFVPIKSEVFTFDTEISYDIPVSKALWDKLDRGDRVELNFHLNGEYSFKKQVKE